MKIFSILLCLLPVIALADSFTIDSVDCDMTRLGQYTPTMNYAVGEYAPIGDQSINNREQHIIWRHPALNDSMQNHEGVTWDSMIVWFDVWTNPLNPDETLSVASFILLQPDWQEGLGTLAGVDTCGADWVWFNDTTGETGCSGDSGSWGTAGALGAGTDYVNTRLQIRKSGGGWGDSLVCDSLGLSTSDSIFIKVTGTDVSDTLNNAGIIIRAIAWIGSGSVTINLNTDDATVGAGRPGLTAYYHEGEEPADTSTYLNLGK